MLCFSVFNCALINYLNHLSGLFLEFNKVRSELLLFPVLLKGLTS